MRKSLFIGLAAVLGLIGCSRNQEIDVPDANLALFARTESPADTKTVVESGVHVYWEPGDEIAVFTGEQSAKFTTDITAASGTATFKGSFGDATWPEDLDLWAVYPFSEDAIFDGETITTTLPSEQVAREGSFGKDMNLAIAHSNSSTLQFYNVGGGIRFSVTEEGIKKVMFEGLSGEIISGKVKIGLEDGLPVIKEVTGGSQFITLLPPSGQDTFQPGTWYYIVAIPGSLEGGYKLRFYKDEDYARKVSEKAVVIKRSVFGNVEKADEGIEYEATTTHFPETQEELVESAKLTEEITSTLIPCVSSIVEDMGGVITDVETIRERLLGIEGIEGATICENNDVIIIKQKDGVHLNLILHTFIEDKNAPEESTNAFSDRVVPSMMAKRNSENRSIPNNQKALILAPFQFQFQGNLTGIKSYLTSAGYTVDCFENEAADITKFKGSFLEKYDVILFDTHGATLCASPDGGPIFNLEGRTILFSGTKYHYDTFDALIDDLFGGWDWSSEWLAVFKTDATIGVCKKGAYWAMSSDDLDGCSFDNDFVFLNACESAKYQTGSKSLFKSFLDKGAGAVMGFNKSVNVWYGNDFLDQLVDGMTQGLCLSVASTYIKTKPYMWNSDNRDSFVYKKADDERYYLVNPYPYDLKSDVDGNSVTLEFSHLTRNLYYEYSIYVDDVFMQKGSPNNPITIDIIPNGNRNHSWYVVANCFINGEHLATYRTDGEDFTVVEPEPVALEAIDLGLSVKWANLNIGANRPEKHGDYYAWGETSQYYNSLNPLTWKPGKESGYSWASYKWCIGSYNSLTKYSTNSLYGYNGFTDGKTILDSEDDVAYVTHGGKWRMPTKKEFDELMNNCLWEWHTENGIDGYKVIGPSGKYIFLPTTGMMYEVNYWSEDTSGYYWTSMNYGGDGAEAVLFDIEGWRDYCYSRYVGYSIRPVYGDTRIPVESVSLNKTYIEISIGGTSNLSATVSPSNATIKDVFWSSGDESVATVSSSGVVKGVSSGSTIITATTADGGRKAMCRVYIKGSYSVALPSVVDLGLSVKWASFNLGATKPEELGDNFTWGDTQPGGSYWPQYKWCMGEFGTLIKYCTDSSSGYLGFTDGKTELDPEDDAAHANLGGKWRMPKLAELYELMYECQWEWINYHGVNGYKVIGPNNNWIFLPGTQQFTTSEDGIYWSGSSGGNYTAYSILFHPNNPEASVYYEHRCWGRSIRPVYDE